MMSMSLQSARPARLPGSERLVPSLEKSAVRAGREKGESTWRNCAIPPRENYSVLQRMCRRNVGAEGTETSRGTAWRRQSSERVVRKKNSWGEGGEITHRA